MRNNYPNLRGSDSNMSLSSSSSLHRNIHPSKSSQSMMLSQTSGSNHHSHNHMTNATTVAAEVPCNSGVYKNKRLVHSMTSLIGCLIEVKLKSGERYEGILKTFSSEVSFVLFIF